MKFFIAGIIQGSKTEIAIHQQDYRETIKRSISKYFPDAQVYDPFEQNKNSLFYTPEYGKKVFLTHNKMCGTSVDVLVAFVPEATMGTAIEIWEAWKNGAITIIISPLEQNWVVKFLSDARYVDVVSFLSALESGAIAKLIVTHQSTHKQRSYETLDIL